MHIQHRKKYRRLCSMLWRWLLRCHLRSFYNLSTVPSPFALDHMKPLWVSILSKGRFIFVMMILVMKRINIAKGTTDPVLEKLNWGLWLNQQPFCSNLSLIITQCQYFAHKKTTLGTSSCPLSNPNSHVAKLSYSPARITSVQKQKLQNLGQTSAWLGLVEGEEIHYDKHL